MTRRTKYVKVTGAVLIALAIGVAVWWFGFMNLTPSSVASAQEIVAAACETTSPDFDLVGTFQKPFIEKPVDVKARFSGTDYHVELRRETQFAEVVAVDGILLEREGVDGEWQPSLFSVGHWRAYLIGSDKGEALCIPMKSTRAVGDEAVDKTSTTKYVWAFSWPTKEDVDAGDTDPWTHRWEVWLDDDGSMVQMQVSTKDPQKDLKGTAHWDIVTSKIVNVGEENIITKPQN